MSIGHFRKPAFQAALFVAAVLTLAFAPAASQAQSCYNDKNPNLVKNGGFEDGYTDKFTVPDWTVAWNAHQSRVVDQYTYVDSTNPHTGGYDMALGATPAADDLQQHIKGTVAGKVYTVCFWLYSTPNVSGGVTQLSVLWNNVSNFDLTNSAQFQYQYYAFNVTASGDDYLRFRERNYQGYYFLDDVSVQLCSGCTLSAGAKAEKPASFAH